jgi:hypothetical protein
MGQDAPGTKDQSVSDELVKEIADAASADTRSVWKRLAGGELRPKVQHRIDREIAARMGARAS